MTRKNVSPAQEKAMLTPALVVNRHEERVEYELAPEHVEGIIREYMIDHGTDLVGGTMTISFELHESVDYDPEFSGARVVVLRVTEKGEVSA